MSAQPQGKAKEAARQRRVALRAVAVFATATLACILLIYSDSSGTPAAGDGTGKQAAFTLHHDRPRLPAPGVGTNSKKDMAAVAAAAAAATQRRHPLTIGTPCALQSGGVHASFASLCGVLKPGVDKQMASFFRATGKPPVRVYVADMEEGRTGLGSACGTFIERYFKTQGMHQAAYATKFASEVLIPGMSTAGEEIKGATLAPTTVAVLSSLFVDALKDVRLTTGCFPRATTVAPPLFSLPQTRSDGAPLRCGRQRMQTSSRSTCASWDGGSRGHGPRTCGRFSRPTHSSGRCGGSTRSASLSSSAAIMARVPIFSRRLAQIAGRATGSTGRWRT